MELIKNGAVFVSDAHENGFNRCLFAKFLDKIEQNPPPQLFLMGDMFDFLSKTCFTKKVFQSYIQRLNTLGKRCEIYYFEGNHDFNLRQIFPQIKVFSLSQQPAVFSSEFGEEFSLAHGDVFLPFFQQVALKMLRARWLVRALDLVDCALFYAISRAILRKQKGKNMGFKIQNFKDLIARKIDRYKTKRVCEGHYHQGESVEFGEKNYFNFAAFGIEGEFYIASFKQKKLIFIKQNLT